MAVDNDSDELEPETPNGASDEDLDDEDDSSDTDDASSTEDKESDSDKGGNRFSKLNSRLSERYAAKQSDDSEDDDDDDDDEDDSSDSPTGDDKSDDQDDDAAQSAKGSTQEPAGAGAAKGGKDEQDKDDEDGDSESRFEVVDKDGSKYELELPEGAVIRFPGDGKTVECKSLDELIQHAQKGVAFDSVTSRQGRTIGQLRQQNTEIADDLKADRELIKSLVTGTISDEDLKALEQYYEKIANDPDAEEAAEALREKREREKQQTEGSDERASQNAAAFWKATDESIAESLPQFEFLDADDAGTIKQAFNQRYLDERARLIEAYKPIAKEHNVSEAEAIRQADEDAIRGVLNLKTLKAVMRGLDDKYRKRAEKGRGKAEERGKAEAKGHNQRVEAQRQRAKDPANRSLRSGGSSLNTRDDRNRDRDKPKSFEGKLDRALSRFRKVTSRDDD